MPSISADVDFDWEDVITKYLRDREITDIARALCDAGKAAEMMAALRLNITTETATALTADEPKDLESDFDRLIDDYACGRPVNQTLVKLAAVYCNRIIVNAGATH